MDRAIFWPSVLHIALYKTLFFDFWFRPPNAQNLLPKICTKSPISRLVWQIDRRCLGLLGGFLRWPIQWNHAKCCGADPCCHGNDIWARRGDPVTYRLVMHSCSFCLFHQLKSMLTESDLYVTRKELTIRLILLYVTMYSLILVPLLV